MELLFMGMVGGERVFPDPPLRWWGLPTTASRHPIPLCIRSEDAYEVIQRVKPLYFGLKFTK